MTSVKDVAAIAGMVAFGAVSATVLAPPASADAQYAWIAYSPSTGVVGTAWNYSNWRAAVARAMQECQNHPLRPGDCRGLSGVAPPGRCLALAIGLDKSQYAVGVGKTSEEAGNDALSISAQGSDPDNYAGKPIEGAHVVQTACNGDQGPDQGVSDVVGA